jgi:hypothetical protein
MEANVNDIEIGERHRRDLGDVRALADSIERIGLLQPIGITKDHRLVFGHRRLEAYKLLGRGLIPAMMIDVRHMLTAEHDENMVRKQFTPSEAVAIAEALREEVETQARERQKELGRTHGKTPPGKFPEGSGDTRDTLARRIGMSGRTYEKARAVVEAAKAEPDKYADLQERMDRSGSVDGAFGELQKRRDPPVVAVMPEPAAAPRISISWPKGEIDEEATIEVIAELWSRASEGARENIIWFVEHLERDGIGGWLPASTYRARYEAEFDTEGLAGRCIQQYARKLTRREFDREARCLADRELRDEAWEYYEWMWNKKASEVT